MQSIKYSDIAELLKTYFMSRVRKNVVTHGLSGKVDTLVFRQRNGKTIVATAPIERVEGPLNAAQKAVSLHQVD